jgi:Toprim-like
MPVLTDTARRYLVEHGIDVLVIDELGITEHHGRLRYPNGRTIALNGDGPKALQPKGTPLELWWPTGPPEDGATVLVCEGESDALAALSTIGLSEIQHQGDPHHPLAGITVAAIPGTGYPARRLAEDLVGTVAVLAFDGDDAGRRATAQAAVELHKAGIDCHDLDVPDGRDVADCLAALDPALRVPWLAGQISDARPVERVPEGAI